MKNVILFLFLLSMSASGYAAIAEWSSSGEITYLSLGKRHNMVLFQLSSDKVGGCDGRFYALDINDHPMGQFMLSLMLSYEARNKPLRVYADGTCTEDYKNANVIFIKTPNDNKSY